jgi:hypothetical protein
MPFLKPVSCCDKVVEPYMYEAMYARAEQLDAIQQSDWTISMKFIPGDAHTLTNLRAAREWLPTLRQPVRV